MQKFNARYTEMRLLAYRSVPLSVPCVFWKFEVRERLGLKNGVGGTRSLASYGTLTTVHSGVTQPSAPLSLSQVGAPSGLFCLCREPPTSELVQLEY